MQNIHSYFSTVSADKLKEAIALVEGRTPPRLGAPSVYERALWNAIKAGIRPHLDGVMPILTQQAFANESPSQREFRRQMYRSESSYLLAQSIQDIYKIVQSDDFLVSFNDEVGDILGRTYLGMRRLGKDMVKGVFSVLYLDRVRDPNGYLGIVPYNYNKDAMGAKSYELQMYPSENIVMRSRDCMVFAIKANEFRVYTLNSTFVMNGDGAIQGEPFKHDSGDLGVYILGGVPQHIEIDKARATALNQSAAALQNGIVEICEVQFSDYSYATNKLDKLENRNSQNEVVTILHCSPKMVARDITCTTCNGRGELDSLDQNGQVLNRVIDDGLGGTFHVPQTHVCNTCKGKKIIDIGTQDVITVPMPTASEPTEGQQPAIADLAKGIIAYVTPDIASADYLYKQFKDERADAKEMLRLQDVEKLNQSGAAKRIDQEAGQPRLRAIAEGLQTLIENVLRGLAAFEYVAGLYVGRKGDAIKSIVVSIPSFFDLLSVSESKENYNLNLAQKPVYERYSEQLNILKKQYNNPTIEKLFKIAYAYTKGANMLTLDELTTNKAMGILTDADVYTAQFISAIIQTDILTPAAESLRPIDVMQTPQSVFFGLIDKALAPILAKQKAALTSVMDLAQSVTNVRADDTENDDENDAPNE